MIILSKMNKSNNSKLCIKTLKKNTRIYNGNIRTIWKDKKKNKTGPHKEEVNQGNHRNHKIVQVQVRGNHHNTRGSILHILHQKTEILHQETESLRQEIKIHPVRIGD